METVVVKLNSEEWQAVLDSLSRVADTKRKTGLEGTADDLRAIEYEIVDQLQKAKNA